ncbi:MAG: biotin--[acetyl-CoA-carboxylase] ligase [Litorilinea sp.]|nr:MAG: biotin--[acetyl-CoA-carboxylase] ligase [Litorilinea sp.]
MSQSRVSQSTLPPLDLAKLRQVLGQSPIGHTIHYQASVPSTMPIAHELARQPATASGTLVVTDEQTAGRGRGERRWETPPGTALLVSVILKEAHLRLPPAQLPMVAGLAVLEAIAGLDPRLASQVWLKWPNDVLLGAEGAQAGKVAGILIETAFQQGELHYAVLGMGINVNQARHELPPVAPPTPEPASIRLALGRVVDRTDLLIGLCQVLAARLMDEPAAVFQAWQERLVTLGQTVGVYTRGLDQEPTLVGQAVGVTPQGELVVMDRTGQRHTFSAGDVSIRRAEK